MCISNGHVTIAKMLISKGYMKVKVLDPQQFGPKSPYRVTHNTFTFFWILPSSVQVPAPAGLS